MLFSLYTLGHLTQLSLQSTSIAQPQEILSIAVGLVAIVLVVISLISYLRTGLKMLLLVSLAFALFAAKTIIHHVNIIFLNLGAGFENTLFSVIDLLILLLFFFALVIRTKPSN